MKAEHDDQLLAIWNQGRHTLADLAVMFGTKRGSVGRRLWELRRMGLYVLWIDPAECSRRRSEGQKQRRAGGLTPAPHPEAGLSMDGGPDGEPSGKPLTPHSAAPGQSKLR